MKRLPRVDQALGRARMLRQAEAEFAAFDGALLCANGDQPGRRRLETGPRPSLRVRTPQGRSRSTKKQLRRRSEQVYGEKASAAVAAARELLVQDDSAGAEAMLKETAPWLDLAPAQAQEELRALEAEAAAAKKVIRFRRGSWR